MKLLIAIPCGDTVRFEFAESLSNLSKRLAKEGIDFTIRFHEGSLVYAAREALSDEAVNDYTHVLWLDSDMVFEDNIFDLLLSANKPFISGIYRDRRGEMRLAIFKKNKKYERFVDIPDDVFEIGYCGFGCVLTSVDVLKQVRGHHFTCFTPMNGVGEDIAFCERWTSLGGKIYAHPKVLLGHISHQIIGVRR